MKSIKEMAEFHLETQIRQAYEPEPPLQMTSRIPADLKIRLDVASEYLGLNRNTLLIEILELALPQIESALDEHQIRIETADINGHRGPFTYRQAFDWAMAYFRDNGKAPKSLDDVAEEINSGRLVVPQEDQQ